MPWMSTVSNLKLKLQGKRKITLSPESISSPNKNTRECSVVAVVFLAAPCKLHMASRAQITSGQVKGPAEMGKLE